MAPKKIQSRIKPKTKAQEDAQPSAGQSTNCEDAGLSTESLATNNNDFPPHTESIVDGKKPISEPILSAPPNFSAPSAAASSTRGRVNPRIATTSRAAGPSENKPRALKFQPKTNVIRRSKEEREAQDRAEEERRLARLRANAPKANYRGAFHARGRGRGGRGGFRGGMNGWRDQRQVASQASGPLSGGPTVGGSIPNKRTNLRGTPADSSSTRDFNNVPSIKAERPSHSKWETTIKNEHQNIPWSAEDDIGAYVDIEHISLISDDDEHDEDPVSSKGKGREKGLKVPGWVIRPIRLQRHEHVERQTKVSTDPSSAISAELRRKQEEKEDEVVSKESEKTVSGQKNVKSKLKDVKIIKEERPWKGVYNDEQDQGTELVKNEPRDEHDTMMIGEVDGIAVLTEVIALDESTEDTSAVGKSSAQDPTEVEAPTEQISTDEPLRPTSSLGPEGISQANHEPFRKAVRRSKATLGLGHKKPILQTPEDHEEWERYQNDITAISEELGSAPFIPKSVSGPKDQEGDTLMEESKEEAEEDKKDRREGMVYLLQLPPVMPNLVSEERIREFREAKKARKTWDLEQERIKKERMKAKASEARKAAASSSRAGAEVKAEPLLENPPEIPKVKTAFHAGDDIESTGDAGTLKVYQSGKVILEWGGMKFSVGMGAPGDILQEAILMDYLPGKTQEEAMEVDAASTATSLGQISGGFSVTPHWQSML
ncbi:hypothetical protein MMC14_004635 [Varicellaria rhodocarpa]|nr:hypothetical protein [Varicellaria rhodocarpa]